jgi:hypothetical protein
MPERVTVLVERDGLDVVRRSARSIATDPGAIGTAVPNVSL